RTTKDTKGKGTAALRSLPRNFCHYWYGGQDSRVIISHPLRLSTSMRKRRADASRKGWGTRVWVHDGKYFNRIGTEISPHDVKDKEIHILDPDKTYDPNVVSSAGPD